MFFNEKLLKLVTIKILIPYHIQLHSRFKNYFNKHHQLSTKWMELYIKTEGFKCAIQDNVKDIFMKEGDGSN